MESTWLLNSYNTELQYSYQKQSYLRQFKDIILCADINEYDENINGSIYVDEDKTNRKFKGGTSMH